MVPKHVSVRRCTAKELKLTESIVAPGWFMPPSAIHPFNAIRVKIIHGALTPPLCKLLRDALVVLQGLTMLWLGHVLADQ